MANRTKRTPATEADFLARLSRGYTVTGACGATGIGRRTVYHWRGHDPVFANHWDNAVEAGNDALEDEARNRAVDGVEEPVFYQGKQCGTVLKYSDSLLMFLLKSRRPEKFSERYRVVHIRPEAGQADLSNLSDQELEALNDLIAKAGVAHA